MVVNMSPPAKMFRSSDGSGRDASDRNVNDDINDDVTSDIVESWHAIGDHFC